MAEMVISTRMTSWERLDYHVQWNLSGTNPSGKTTLSGKTISNLWNFLSTIGFNANWPVWNDHLSGKTTFSWHLGWLFQTGFTVLAEIQPRKVKNRGRVFFGTYIQYFAEWYYCSSIVISLTFFLVFCSLWQQLMDFSHTWPGQLNIQIKVWWCMWYFS